MGFDGFDVSDRTWEDIQLLIGDNDVNLDVLQKQFKTTFIFRDQMIKYEKSENTPMIRSVLQACFDIIDTRHRLETQDVAYLVQLAKQNQLSSFKARQLVPVGKTRAGKLVYPKTVGQAIFCEALRNNEIVFTTGVAGTGKTYLSVAYAVAQWKQAKVEKIILTRPAVEAGESLGFLPGDMKDKVDPYLRPLYDALYEMLGVETVEKLMEKQVIEIAPLAFMRGRTLSHAIVILDEAQNTTQAQMKMFLTRMGARSQLIINGDLTQIDLVKKTESGLRQACQILKGIPGIEIIELSSADVVRHPLVQQIIERYAEIEK